MANVSDRLRARARQGLARTRRALVPVLLASLAAGVAYAIARYGLGHQFPFFAPVAAWLAIGFSADRDPRRVTELAVGVALGVLAGDLVVHVIGTGPVQVAVVLAGSVLLARFLDRGDLLAVQAGVQAVVVSVLPPASISGGPVGRWLDALVGGAVALLLVALWPQDPRRRVRAVSEEALGEVADVLHALATGLRTADAAEVRRALLQGRSSQPVLDTWRAAATAAQQSARISPAFRRHRDELASSGAAATTADCAMRNVRVLARRAETVVVREIPGERLVAIADALDEAARAAVEVGSALSTGAEPLEARRSLERAGAAADPYRVAPGDLHVQGLVLILRSVVVDLAETAGLEPEAARALLTEV